MIPVKDNDNLFTMTFGRRITLFACLFLLCLIIGLVLTSIIVLMGKGSVSSLRIATIVQDLMLFIIPAIATAVIISRRSDRFLQIGTAPGWRQSGLVIATVIASIPLINFVGEWNQNMHLPESLSGIEQLLRSAEDSAQASVDLLIGGTSVMSCVFSVLLVGVLAGFSEELFFRGTLQRLMITKPVNAHLAIWLTAFIFSAVHFQFFGFVPRLLLGALFGYIAVWTGNLWLPIMAHAFNNSLVVLTSWLERKDMLAIDFNSIGSGTDAGNLAWVVASAIAVGCCLWLIYRLVRR